VFSEYCLAKENCKKNSWLICFTLFSGSYSCKEDVEFGDFVGNVSLTINWMLTHPINNIHTMIRDIIPVFKVKTSKIDLGYTNLITNFTPSLNRNSTTKVNTKNEQFPLDYTTLQIHFS